MNVLLLNLPFIEHKNGELWSGPSAGSCWPHTVRGLYSYVPFPFFLANATSYLQAHGISADLLDAWAHRCTSYEQVQLMVQNRKPDVLVIEINTPLAVQTLAFAKWAKEALGCKVVLVGPHCAAYADELLALPFIDHVVIGEYDIPVLKIAHGDTTRKFSHEQVKDISNIGGKNWLPYRDSAILHNYLDPSMCHVPMQLQFNTSRGCKFSCTFCSWPSTIYRTYRNRAAANVLDEIRTVMKTHKVGSLFADDEMYNTGDIQRQVDLCNGLKEIGLPWTYMGRIDTSTKEMFRMQMESGCVGARFGIESFHQRLIDAVKKHLNVQKSWENITWLLTNFAGKHFRLLTMKKLPGETPAEELEDEEKFAQLVELGRRNGNLVTVQTAICTPLPGTEMWRQLQAAGEGDKMKAMEEFNPLPAANSPLAERLRVYESATKDD